MKVYSQLIKARFEQVTSDLTESISGLFWQNTTSKKLKFHDGSEVKEVVDTNSTQTLSAKTLSSPVIQSPTVDVTTLEAVASTPSTPSSGKHKFYIKSGGAKLLSESGTEKTIATTDYVDSVIGTIPVTPPQVNNYFTGTLKNYLINGSFDFWQRATSASPVSIGSKFFLADRWLVENQMYSYKVTNDPDNPGDTFTDYLYSTVKAEKSLDVPSGLFSKTSIKLTPNIESLNVPSFTNAGGGCVLSQAVEGFFSRDLEGKSLVLSFWVKFEVAGTYCVNFSNGLGDRLLVKEFSVSQSNTWEKKIIRFSHTNIGTWRKDFGTGLRVSFVLFSNLLAEKDSWLSRQQSTEWVATSSQVTPVANKAFMFTEIYLSEDVSPSSDPAFALNRGDLVGELEACQRYFETSYSPQGYFGGTVSPIEGRSIVTSLGGLTLTVPYSVAKRHQSHLVGLHDLRRDGISGGFSATIYAKSTSNNFFIVTNSGVFDSVNRVISFHFSSDSEIT